MVKATKEILEGLGIENLFLSGSDESEKWLLRPVELGASHWICTLDNPCFAANVTCNIRVKDEYLRIPAEVELIEGNIYRLEFMGSSRELKGIRGRIKELEREFSFLEKRRERRYEVGIRGSEQLGIVVQDKQRLIYGGNELPCFFNNVSYNGCSVTTMQTEMIRFTAGEEVALKLCLSNPLENIFMHGRVCSVALKTPENGMRFKFAILSVELSEPPLAWERRLSEYIRTMER